MGPTILLSDSAIPPELAKMSSISFKRITSHTYFFRPIDKLYEMPTSSHRKPGSTCITILSLVSIAMFSGCDLGTYKKRLNESHAEQTAPQEPNSESTGEDNDSK